MLLSCSYEPHLPQPVTIEVHLAAEACVSAPRKAYRLGKWLQNVNKVRKQPVKTRMGVLELVSNGGEAVYYFVEQFTW